jgi:sentrin-specific protease 1
LSDRSFLAIQNLRAQREDSRSSPDVIILDDKEDRSEERTTAKSPDASSVSGRQTVDTLPSPKPAAAVELEKSLKENKFTSDDWIHDLTGKYSLENRRRNREVQEEEIKCTFFKEKREEWEHMLEQKLRKRLTLAERDPPVLEDEYVEDEEETDEFPDLTQDMEEMIQNALYPHPPNEVLVEAFRLQIKRCDMNTLAGLNWLNDEVINFYMELLKDRGTQEEYPSVHVFNTFFYPKLMSGGHSALKRWTKKIDIFSVDYILIPVHLGMHWCLSVVDMTKKEVRYYDSMGGVNNGCLNALREYLRQEHEVKKSSPLDMSSWKLITMKNIPQQMNGSDCGVFTCKFAEYVSRGAEITFTQEHMPYFRQRMVYEILTTKLL